MPATLSTITVLDGNGVPILVRVVDTSGTGVGPFSWGNTIKDGEGVATAVAVKGPSTIALATDPSLVTTLSPTSAPHKVWDGTNTAAVKPASTSPIATDPALVVSQSPNSASK